MNDHTHRLLDRMRILIDQYKQKKVSLRILVDGLEENLNALEERLPESFYTGWYSYWGELEVILAMCVEDLSTEDQKSTKILEAADALKSLIESIQSSYDKL